MAYVLEVRSRWDLSVPGKGLGWLSWQASWIITVFAVIAIFFVTVELMRFNSVHSTIQEHK